MRPPAPHTTPSAVLAEIRARFAAMTKTPAQRSRLLLMARLLWGAIVACAVATYLATLPMYLASLEQLCAPGDCIPGQLSSTRLAQQLGISLDAYARGITVFNALTATVWFTVGLVIFVRRSHEWMGYLVSLMLMLTGATAPPYLGASVWQFPAQAVNYLSFVSMFLVFCLFPRGRFVPRWLVWAAVAYAALNLFDFFPSVLAALPLWLLALYFLLLFGCIGVLGVAQVYRYQQISSPIERQQAKWVVLGSSAVIVCEFALWIVSFFFQPLGRPSSFSDLLFSPLSIFVIQMIPLSFGFAILRYRLWDIDVLINRTLVYATLTGALALVYLVSIVVLQEGLRRVTGQGSQLAIVLSTLAIAALFQPLRGRIQTLIDRRFYRSRYDAARTLAAFSARLRDEVDLNQLRAQLAAVVAETMQPSSVSIWLRPAYGGERQTAPEDQTSTEGREANSADAGQSRG
jgi:hypothetical protein